MNKKEEKVHKIDFKKGLPKVKIFLAILLSLLIIGFSLLFGFYLKLQVDAKDAVASAEKTIQEEKINGLNNTEEQEKKLAELKQDLEPINSFQELQETKNEALEIKEQVKNQSRETFQTKRDVLSEELKNFETTFREYDSIPLPGRQKYEVFIKEANESIENNSKNISDLDNIFNQLKTNKENLEEEVDTVQTKLFLNSVNDSFSTVDELIGFFEKRYGYASEIESLNTYKKLSSEIISAESTEKHSYDQLQSKYETEILPHLEGPSNKKAQIDEEYRKQRLAWIEEEKQRRASNGLGPAPTAPLEREKLIYVNIGSQYLYAYDQGDLIYSSPVTTGKNGFATVKGEFKIYAKTRNRTLISPFTTDKNDSLYYEVDVAYWMPFYSGYGLHDAPWRSRFGGQDYTWNGSHGCVNMPTATTKFIWNWAEIGTPVYVN